MIIVNLDVILAKRKMQSKELAQGIGVPKQRVSLLKTGKRKAMNLETLDKICNFLDCQPSDILEYVKNGN